MVSHHRRSKIHGVSRSFAMAKHLTKRGHRITLLTTADSKKLGIDCRFTDGVEIIDIPDLLWGSLRSGWDPWSGLNRLLFLLKRGSTFDLVHLFESRPATTHPLQFYKYWRQTPLIIDWVDWIGRGGLLEIRRPKWYKALFGGMETFYEEFYRAKADGGTVICSALKDRAERLGMRPDSILKIPNGVDFEYFQDTLEKGSCRDTLGFPVGEKILTFAAMDADFDFQILLDAMLVIVRRYPKARLMITGRVNPRIQRWVHQNSFSGHLLFTGFVAPKEFPIYLGSSDLFLLPISDTIYNRGRWPSKVTDYMAAGRPIVANPVGDVRELFSNHRIGLLANYDHNDLADKVLALLDNEDLAQELGHNARQVALEHYNWANLIVDLEDLYFRIIGSDRV